MKTLKPFLFVFTCILILIACQKEYSVESTNNGALASGTLKDTSGNCQDIIINGNYIADSTLNANNYVIVNVNITSPGNYKISTDSRNGFSFQDSGFIASTGVQTVKLKATGKPLIGTTTDFQVTFGTSVCLFSINVTGAGSGGGGGSSAVFTLTPGAGGNCSNAVVQGTYATGTQLNSSNKVILQVNVTTPGTYTISTGNVNGMTFAGIGNFATTGPQTITLQGGGSPRNVGSNVIPVNAGSSTCNFTVNVAQGTNSGNNPNLSDSAWSFTQGTLSAHGPFDFAFDTSIASIGYALVLEGSTAATADSALTLAILFSGNQIATGTYNTATFASLSYDDYRTGTPVNIYSADNTTVGASTIITITAWDSATRIVSGTFSGTVKNKAGQTVPITAGKFRARVE